MLPIPPLAKNQSKDAAQVEFYLTAESGQSTLFGDRPATTYGYNGPYLGPTLRAKRGQHVRVHVRNSLNEAITTHWHGMLLPGAMDGGPRQLIEPDHEWVADFDVTQPAATLWYHPHTEGATGRLVYMGLGGLFILDDEHSDSLALPKDYGINDIPLILQDRTPRSDGSLLYAPNMMEVMTGLRGERLLVNGAVAPVFDAPAGKVRFRILNASNARSYRLRLSDGSTFRQIASDGGFLKAPIELKEIALAPAERAELVVDFAGHKTGEELSLVSESVTVLKCRIGAPDPNSHALPSELAQIDRIPEQQAKRTRSFVLQVSGMAMGINGRQMNMDRIDEVVGLHDIEIWSVTNQAMGMGGGMMGMGNIAHTFHVHGVQFQILDRNGRPPAASESGWKDTIGLDPGETVRLIMRFDYPGIFMYHCHILEHEDHGMMGQFEVR